MSFSERTRLVHPWALRTSPLDTASLHYLRNGPAFLWSSFSLIYSFTFFFSCTKYHHARSQLNSAWLISSPQLSSAPHIQQKRSAVRCRAVPCPAVRYGVVRCCAMRCRAACFAVLALSNSFVHSRYHSRYQNDHNRSHLSSVWLTTAQLSSVPQR